MLNKRLGKGTILLTILTVSSLLLIRSCELQTIKKEIEEDKYIWIIEVDNDWYQSYDEPKFYESDYTIKFTDLDGKKNYIKNYKRVRIYQEEVR